MDNTILWTGETGTDLHVHTKSGVEIHSLGGLVSSAPAVRNYIPNNEGPPGRGNGNILPSVSSRGDLTRVAAVMGYVPYGGRTPGGMKKLSGYTRECIAAYDIESSTENELPGGFGLPDAEIISVCALCSCGSSLRSFGGSSNCSLRLYEWVTSHKPRWLIGWNNYLYDNQALLYHCSAWKAVSSVVRVSAVGNVGYGILFDIAGVYNIDAYVYVLRSRPAQFDAYSLSSIASSLQVTQKMSMPTMTSSTSREVILEYNMNDCRVTLDIWLTLNVDMELIALCLCASCSMYDACRYVTGTMMGCMLASYATSTASRLLWNPCSVKYDFEGGFVMEPIRGIHRNVFVCDFSSMYPSVIIGCNISPESITVSECDTSMTTGEVTWNTSAVSVRLKDCTTTFKYRESSLLKNVEANLISERQAHKKTDKYYSLSLKVCANSIYGAVGFSSSSMYSPRCAASVTSISRWALRQASECFRSRGLVVVGGDTDSCFVRPLDPKEKVTLSRQRVEDALSDMKNKFAGGPLEGLSMEIEDYFPTALLLHKKRYCKLTTDGTMKITGMTFAKKSEPEMRRLACRQTCLAVLCSNSDQDARNRVKSVAMYHTKRITSGSSTLSYISGLRSQDGTKKYTYVTSDGSSISFPPDKSTVVVHDYDPHPLLEILRTEISSITVAAGLGTLAECIMYSSTW